MLIFVLKRLVSTLWTLILVMMVSFFLIQLAPGDKAEAILNVQGIKMGEDDNQNYFIEYEALREEYGLNKPSFYISLLPSYKNHSFPSHWHSRHTILANNLLHKKVPFKNVNDYINALDELEMECQDQSLSLCNREIRFLWELTDLDDIKQRLNRVEHENNISLTQLKRASDQLSSHTELYFPVIKWNGLNNQFHNRIFKILKLDFGISVVDGDVVTNKIASALIWTLVLTFATLFLSLLLGIPLSIYSVKSSVIAQRVIGTSMNIIYATPVFWLATLLIVFFTTPEYGRWTDIFPGSMFKPGDYSGWWDSLSNNSGMLVLPVFCLTLSSLPVIVRITRRSIISESVEPYITALRGRGLTERSIFRRHIIPNALMPIVTLISNSLPSAMAGTLIVEVIFNIPGMGRLMYDSLSSYDWDVCFAIIILMSVVTSVVFAVADVIYYQINPKMKSV
ncbi:MAG: ABC transporter permease [Saprospiraceae bacterium]|nr:ABC transporter permease [Saprospiraceae bacterium]